MDDRSSSELDILKSELLKHIDAFEVLANLNPDLKPDILIKNLKKVLTAVNYKGAKKIQNHQNQPNNNPGLENGAISSNIVEKIISRRGSQNKEKYETGKKGTISDSTEKSNFDTGTNELYWGDFEKRRSGRKRVQSSDRSQGQTSSNDSVDMTVARIVDNTIIQKESLSTAMKGLKSVQVSKRSNKATLATASHSTHEKNISIEKKLVTTENGNSKFVYECLLCGRQLSYDYNAQRHMRNIHSRGRLPCPNFKSGCTKIFDSNILLKSHLKGCKPREAVKRGKNCLPIPSLNLVLNNPFKNFKLKSTLDVKVLVKPLLCTNSLSWMEKEDKLDNSCTNFNNGECGALEFTSASDLKNKTNAKRASSLHKKKKNLLKQQNNSLQLLPYPIKSETVKFNFVRSDMISLTDPNFDVNYNNHPAESLSASVPGEFPTCNINMLHDVCETALTPG